MQPTVYLALFLLTTKGDEECAHICLHWTFNATHLTLTCKISDLRYTVSIINQFEQEQGYCSPPQSRYCERHFKNGSISENFDKSEVIFSMRGRIDDHLNGQWMCKHGENKHVASVEVTIPRLHVSEVQVHICWLELTFYALIGYIPTCFGIFGLIWVISYLHGDRNCEKTETEIKITDLIRKHIGGGNIGILKSGLGLLVVLVIGIPAVVGVNYQRNCSGKYIFVIVGLLEGVLSSFLLLSILYRERNPNERIYFRSGGSVDNIRTIEDQESTSNEGRVDNTRTIGDQESTSNEGMVDNIRIIEDPESISDEGGETNEKESMLSTQVQGTCDWSRELSVVDNVFENATVCTPKTSSVD